MGSKKTLIWTPSAGRPNAWAKTPKKWLQRGGQKTPKRYTFCRNRHVWMDAYCKHLKKTKGGSFFWPSGPYPGCHFIGAGFTRGLKIGQFSSKKDLSIPPFLKSGRSLVGVSQNGQNWGGSPFAILKISRRSQQAKKVIFWPPCFAQRNPP